MSGNGRLTFDQLSKSFERPNGARTVVADCLDFDVGPGTSVGIIGGNGVGKSTLLRMAAGVSAPSSGRVLRSGRTCAVIDLGAGLHPDLTGRENIQILQALYSVPAKLRSRQLVEVVEFAGLGVEIDNALRTYSTGMVARLALSTALHLDPDLLLLDEVLSVGDVTFQHAVKGRVAELRVGGTTVVLVSHDMELVETLCDRAVVLVEGRLVVDGPAGSTIDRYIGRPAALKIGQSGLELKLESTVVRSGAEVVGEISGLPVGTRRVQFDLVVREHPLLVNNAEKFSIVFASSEVESTGGRRMSVALATEYLPAGRFEVRCLALNDLGLELAIGQSGLTIVAGEGLFAIRLAGSNDVAYDL